MTANAARGVLVVAEVSDGRLSGTTQELLGVGRRLAEALGEELAAAVLGSQLGASGQEAIVFGASGLLGERSSDPYQQTLNGVRYIQGRYGSPANAVAFWQSHRWY